MSKIPKRRLDEYVISGMEVPEGLLESYFNDYNKHYKPSASVKLMYKLITNRDYEYQNN